MRWRFHLIEWAIIARSIGKHRPMQLISADTARRARRYVEEFLYAHALFIHTTVPDGAGNDHEARWVAGTFLTRNSGADNGQRSQQGAAAQPGPQPQAASRRDGSPRGRRLGPNDELDPPVGAVNPAVTMDASRTFGGPKLNAARPSGVKSRAAAASRRAAQARPGLMVRPRQRCQRVSTLSALLPPGRRPDRRTAHASTRRQPLTATDRRLTPSKPSPVVGGVGGVTCARGYTKAFYPLLLYFHLSPFGRNHQHHR